MDPGPVTMLTTPGGRSACRHRSAKRRADSGVVEAGFSTTVLPAGEGRGDLPGEHQQREVPRDDLRRDAERPGGPTGKRVVELVGPARVVPEVRRGQWDVDVARFLDRLARIDRLENGELARALLEQTGDPVQVLGALPPGQVPQRRLKAVRAARTAASTSAGPPFATLVSTSSVAGSTSGKVSPDAAATNRPLMKRPYRSAIVTMSRDSGAGA